MLTDYFNKKDWALLVIAVVLILCQVWMDIEIPDYMGEITDHIVLHEQDVVVEKGIEMVACAILSLVFSLCASFVMANLSASVGRNMRIRQFDRVQSFSVQDINRFSAASLITRSTNDVTQIQNFIARGLQVCIKCPIITVWGITKIYGSSIEWTATVVIGILVLMAVMLLTLHFANKRFRKVQWLTDGVNRSVRENLDGIRVIRAFNAEDYQEKKFEKANDELLENNLAAMRVLAPALPLAQSMMNFVSLAIYWIGASLIEGLSGQSDQFMMYSDMIVFTSYATMVLGAVMQFFGTFRSFPRAMVGYRRVPRSWGPSLRSPTDPSPKGRRKVPWSSATSVSGTPVRTATSSPMYRSASIRVPRSRSSGPPGPANRPWWSLSRGSTMSLQGPCWSTGSM